MGNIDWGKIGQILGSPAVQNISGIAGAGISAYADNKQGQANTRQQAAQFAAQMALQQQSQAENQRQGAAGAAAAAAPLGANENFAAKQALRSMVLSGLRNPSVQASDPGVAAAMPKITSAFQLPEGGVPQSVLAHLSPSATAGAIANRQNHISNIDPNAPGVNFERMGFGAADAAGPQAETNAFQGQALGRFDDQQTKTAENLKLALAQSQAAAQDPEKKKGGGFLGKLGGALKFAAPIAAMAIPGLGPLAAAAIAGGGTAAGSLMQGQGVGSAVGQGALSAGVGAAGARRPAAAPAASTPPFQSQNLARALRRDYFGASK
jgi:hypothetical protein